MHLLGHLGLHHLSIVRAGCTDGLLPEIGGLGVKVVAIMERRGGGACSCLHRHPPAPLFHLEAEATDRNHSPPLQYWGSLHPRTLASLSFHFKGFLGTTYCQRVDCFKKEFEFPLIYSSKRYECTQPALILYRRGLKHSIKLVAKAHKKGESRG